MTTPWADAEHSASRTDVPFVRRVGDPGRCAHRSWQPGGQSGLHAADRRRWPGSGLAGAGLALLQLARAREDEALHERALGVARRLAASVPAPPPTPPAPGRAGFLEGWTGPALLFCRMFSRTGDPAWLAAARSALRVDLAACTPAGDGSLPSPTGPGRCPTSGWAASGWRSAWPHWPSWRPTPPRWRPWPRSSGDRAVRMVEDESARERSTAWRRLTVGLLHL